MSALYKKIFRGKRLTGSEGEIDPDEIFLDSSNLPQFDTAQFEGRLEKPIGKSIFILAGFAFVLVCLVFIVKLWSLQVSGGENFASISTNNTLRHTTLFSERGVIYDRNNKLLAWNEPNPEDNDFSLRKYTSESGMAHVLGYLKYPSKDSSGVYYKEVYEGMDGIEKIYHEILAGKNGRKIVETDALFEVKSESLLNPPIDGENVTLSIDSRVQTKLYGIIEGLSQDVGFYGGAGIIMDVKSGELLSMVSYPEYDPNILTSGGDSERIDKYIQDKGKPFLNRIISGLYTPGSIVKPFLAIGALEEGIISPNKKINSIGYIEVPNPYNPEQVSIFNDWKAHGPVDMSDAIALSSNVYFYEIGGGFEDQKGLGIKRIEEYMRKFGFGELQGGSYISSEPGVIPNPEWKSKVFDGDDWRLGDTYHTAIGQYGFQVTPYQAVIGTAAIANGGKLLSPSIIKEGTNAYVPSFGSDVGIDENNIKVAREGMRQAVTSGTAQGLYLPHIQIAAKTGTAELGLLKQRVNSWVIGFFPYDEPKYAFAVLMENGPVENTIGGLYVMRNLVEWMSQNTPEYIN